MFSFSTTINQKYDEYSERRYYDDYSSPYGLGPKRLKMGIQRSGSQAEEAMKNSKKFPFDKKWEEICKKVIPISPKSSTENKIEPHKENHVKFEDEHNKKEMPDSDHMFYYFRVNEKTRKMKEIVALKSSSQRAINVSEPENSKHKKFDDFLEITKKNKKLTNIIGDTSAIRPKRRKSCHCSWCGGISKLEKKISKHLKLSHYFDYSHTKEVKNLSVSLSPANIKSKKPKSFAGVHHHKNKSKENLFTIDVHGNNKGRTPLASSHNTGSQSSRKNKTPDRDRVGRKSLSFGTPTNKHTRKESVRVPSAFVVTESTSNKEKQISDQNELTKPSSHLKLESEVISTTESKQELFSRNGSGVVVAIIPSKKTSQNFENKVFIKILTGNKALTSKNGSKRESSKKNTRPGTQDMVRELSNLKSDMNKIDGYMKHIRKKIIKRAKPHKKAENDSLEQDKDLIASSPGAKNEQDKNDIKIKGDDNDVKEVKKVVVVNPYIKFSKTLDIYTNTSELYFLKSSLTKNHNSKSYNMSRAGSQSALRFVRSSNGKIQTEQPYLVEQKGEKEYNQTLPLNHFGYDLPKNDRQTKNKVMKVRIVPQSTDSDTSTTDKHYLPALDKKKSDFQLSSSTSSLRLSQPPLAKSICSSSTKALLEYRPASEKSPQDFIDSFYFKKVKKISKKDINK